MKKAELLEWLQAKLADAEKSLKARKEMEATWKGGSDASWRAVGCKRSKAERLMESAMQGRIAKKAHREVEMFKEVIRILSSSANGAADLGRGE